MYPKSGCLVIFEWPKKYFDAMYENPTQAVRYMLHLLGLPDFVKPTRVNLNFLVIQNRFI